MVNLGLQFGYPILFWGLGFTGVLALGGAVLAIRNRRAEYSYANPEKDRVARNVFGAGLSTGFTGLGLFVILAIVAACSLFPYQAKYWYLYSVSGTVQKVTATVS